MRISAKPTKRLQEALQPILAKHGLSLEQVVLHRVSEGAVGGAGRGRREGFAVWLIGSKPLSVARGEAAVGFGEASELSGFTDTGFGHSSR